MQDMENVDAIELGGKLQKRKELLKASGIKPSDEEIMISAFKGKADSPARQAVKQ